MMTALRSSRLPRIALATVVAVMTLVLVANAVQSISVPNISAVSYALAPGANSPDITLASGTLVLVMADCTTPFRRGVAQVTMQRTSVAPLFLQWVGLSSPAGPAVVGDWFPGGVSPHIVWVDFAHQVELRVVPGSTSAIDVQSLIPAGGPVATGQVKLMW